MTTTTRVVASRRGRARRRRRTTRAAKGEGAPESDVRDDATTRRARDDATRAVGARDDGGLTRTRAERRTQDVAPALESDWREFRAQLLARERAVTPEEERARAAAVSEENLKVLETQNPRLAASAPWAHVIGAPEKGCLLVAADHEFRMSQQYFHQAVILVLEHHENGSMGVILNRPTQYDMGYVSGEANGPFAKNALYFGGDVGDGTVSFLHGREDVKGSVEVLPGVYLGGYDSACELVQQDGSTCHADEFKFFARYCGWAPGQLESECERGVWFPVAAAKELSLKQVIQLPKPLWREISELCGGELEEMARKAYQTYEAEQAFSLDNLDADERATDE